MATATRRLLVATTASSSINSNSSSAADSPQPSVAVESDFVVIVAALLCALICVLGLFAVARCALLRNSTNTTTTTTAQSSYSASGSAAVANKGIKKKILHSFPKFVFDSNCHSSSSDGGGGGLDDCCAICLAEFVDGDEIRVLPHCGHGFHAGCVDTWLSRRSSCPSCRRILVGAKNRCQNCGHFPAIAPPV